MQHYSRREIEEGVFTLIWKVSFFISIFTVELSIFFNNLSNDQSVWRKALVCILLLFTLIELLLALVVDSWSVRKKSSLLFVAGVTVIGIGVWTEILAIR